MQHAHLWQLFSPSRISQCSGSLSASIDAIHLNIFQHLTCRGGGDGTLHALLGVQSQCSLDLGAKWAKWLPSHLPYCDQAIPAAFVFLVFIFSLFTKAASSFQLSFQAKNSDHTYSVPVTLAGGGRKEFCRKSLFIDPAPFD